MRAKEIREQASSEEWFGLEELIENAKRVHGAPTWTKGFCQCEDCGRLVIDPAVFDDEDSSWHLAQVGTSHLDRSGNTVGLPAVVNVCIECFDKRKPEILRLETIDADRSWQRARLTN